jgi:hypothetical protein
MNVITRTSRKDRGTVSEASIITIAEFDKAFEAQEDNFERGAKAWRRYFPINYGKWDPAALKVLQEEFRHPVQFDISSPKADALAGSLVADLPDPTWVPVQGERGLLTEAIADEYYTDRDLYNFDDVFLKVFRDGIVHAGDLEITEDYKHHVPRIKLSRIMYGFLVWDPYWLTDDDRDAEVAYRVAYMTAEKLMRTYKHATEEILREVRDYKSDKSGYEKDPEIRQLNRDGRVGDELQVIEKHYLEHIKTTRLVGRTEGGQQWIPFPINRPREYLELFAETNRIDWETVVEDTYEDRVHYVTTVVRELSNAEIQLEAKSKIQVNGLPFHHFTMRRWAGKDMGDIETMADVEDTINKRESLITELVSKASGGSQLVNENLFKSPQEKQEWAKKKNKPGHSQFVDLDSVKTPYVNMVTNQFPSGIADQINRMYEQVLPLVSRVSAALSSMSDNAGEPGILFERKFQMNMIANTLMNRNMRQFINNVAESYFFQWQITYGDYEHEVVSRDGKKRVTLNKRRGGMIYNSVRSVPRCRVVIAENAKSQTYQMRWRSVWAEMLQSINPQVAPAQYMMALKNFFETIQTTDADKEQIKVINEMSLMVARLQMISQATGFQTAAQNNTMQSQQIEMQMQAMMQQMQQSLPQPAPTGHMEPQPQVEEQYPDESVPSDGFENMSPVTPTEEASQVLQTQPALTGEAK